MPSCFLGPEGNHKLALAIAYAQLINCTHKVKNVDGLELDSCGVCPSCIKYQKLIHPDLHFIYPISTTKKVPKKPKSKDFIEEWRQFLLQTNFQVDLLAWYEMIGLENKQGIINADDCLEIISTLSYKSYESEYKVMILWMVEKLFYAAAPKILKILEEPPDKTLFILIADDPDQIISTIRSRTLLVKIPEIPSQSFSVDDAQHLQTFQTWMRLCFRKDLTALVSWSNEIAKIGRENQKSLLHYALWLIESSVAVNYGNEQRIDAKEEEMKFIQGFSKFINASNVIAFTDLFGAAIFHIERNVHTPSIFLDLSLQTIRLFHSSPK
jgi:DNA polymerase-3 subunit delta'